MSYILNSITRAAAERSSGRVGHALAYAALEERKPIAPTPTTNESTGDTSAGPSDHIGLDRLAATLWRKRQVVLASAMLGLMIALMWSVFCTPTYRAHTAIQLDKPLNPYAALATQAMSVDSESAAPTESYIQNEIKVLGSDSLAQRVADHLNDTVAPAHSTLPEASPLRRFIERLHTQSPSKEELQIQSIHRAVTIRTSLKSQVVEISFDSNDPVRAATGANTLVSEYLAMNREAQVKTARDTTEWLSSQVLDLKAKIDLENKELREFATHSGLIYSPNQGALAEQRVSELQTELTKANNDRATAQSRYQTAADNALEALPDDGDNTLLHTYQANLAAAERELENMRAIYTEDNYKISEAQGRVAQLQKAIGRERLNILNRLKAEYEAAARVQSSIQSAYNMQTQRLQSQSSDIFRYNSLKHELDTTQQLYDAVLQKIKEAEIASSLQATNVRVIDYARPPSNPYSPNLHLNAGLGLISGLLFGIIWVLVRCGGTLPSLASANNKGIGVREIAAIPDVPSSRLLPGFGHPLWRPHNNPPLALAAWTGASAFAESYSSAVASILFSPGMNRPHRAIAITSAKPQEGKTTVIANLAVKMAESFGRVLLIDGDLRRPGLHTIFERYNDAGLTTILRSSIPVGSLDTTQFIQPTKVEQLFLMASGPGVPSITPLLHSKRFHELLSRLRHDFDYVLIDTPPTSLFSDARLIARGVDSVIFVVNEEKTNAVCFDVAYRQFLDDGANVLGAIRNQAAVDASGQSYSDYTKYGSA